MKIQMICLANSYKEKGRCLAGIQLENNLPLIQNGRPKWIRPICETEHGEIPWTLVFHINLLDIIEIEVYSEVPDGHQSENVLFDANAIKIIGKFSVNQLDDLCEHSENFLFGNRGAAVTPENTNELMNSLRMIKVEKFHIVEKIYEDLNSTKLRLSFLLNQISYEIPITDTTFIHLYKKDKLLVAHYSHLFLTISLGIAYEDWHYKLVAAIIY